MVNNTINKSIHSGRVPDDIKLAKVIPIYKAKDKELLNNYRPISLLTTTSKILEKKLFTKGYIICWFLNQYFIIVTTVLDPNTQLLMQYTNL